MWGEAAVSTSKDDHQHRGQCWSRACSAAGPREDLTGWWWGQAGERPPSQPSPRGPWAVGAEDTARQSELRTSQLWAQHRARVAGWAQEARPQPGSRATAAQAFSTGSCPSIGSCGQGQVQGKQERGLWEPLGVSRRWPQPGPEWSLTVAHSSHGDRAQALLGSDQLVPPLRGEECGSQGHSSDSSGALLPLETDRERGVCCARPGMCGFLTSCRSSDQQCLRRLACAGPAEPQAWRSSLMRICRLPGSPRPGAC